MYTSIRLSVPLFLCLSWVSAAVGYQEIQVKNGGTISGQVLLTGAIPSPGVLSVQKSRDVCGEQVPDQSLLVGPDHAVKNVSVILDGIRAGKPASTQLAVLDNKACAFVPRVQTLTVGQTLELRNSDPILHDAHALLPSFDTLFNLGLPTWRQVRRVMQDTGRIVIDCNVLHTWMRAYLIVTEHPYTAVTNAAGRFSLDQVPVGDYTLRLWHERLGEMTQAVSIGENQELPLTLEYDGKK